MLIMAVNYDSVRNGNSQVAVSVTYPNNDVNGSGNFIESNLCIISYNMHGYSQGFNSIRGLINSYAPDMFLIQEHWLTPHNMSRFRPISLNIMCLDLQLWSVVLKLVHCLVVLLAAQLYW